MDAFDCPSIRSLIADAPSVQMPATWEAETGPGDAGCQVHLDYDHTACKNVSQARILRHDPSNYPHGCGGSNVLIGGNATQWSIMRKKPACRPKPLNGRMQRAPLSVSKHAGDAEVSYIPAGR